MDEIIFPINMVDFPYKNGGLIWFHAICGYKFQWIIMDYHHFPYKKWWFHMVQCYLSGYPGIPMVSSPTSFNSRSTRRLYRLRWSFVPTAEEKPNRAWQRCPSHDHDHYVLLRDVYVQLLLCKYTYIHTIIYNIYNCICTHTPLVYIYIYPRCSMVLEYLPTFAPKMTQFCR